MNVLYAITCIVAILFMSVGMFIGIWLFIVALKAFRQLKYKNYILEKIYQKLDKLSENSTNDQSLSDSSDFFDLSDIPDDISSFDNIKSFDKCNKK